MKSQGNTDLWAIAKINKWSSVNEHHVLDDLLKNGSREPSDIAEIHDISDKTAKKIVELLSELDLVLMDGFDVSISGYGRLIHKLQAQLFDSVDPEIALRLVSIENHLQFLSVLRLGPLDNEAITEACDFSSRTLTRIAGEYSDENWVQRRNSQFELTERGREGITAAKKFINDFENTIDKAPFFKRYFGPLGDLPTGSIAEAEMVSHEEENPHAVFDAFREITNEAKESGEITDVKTVTPIFSPPLIDLYVPVIKKGAHVTCMVGRDAYKTIQKPNNVHQLLRFKDITNVDVEIHKDVLDYGLGIINENVAQLVAYQGGDSQEVGLHSDDDEFVSWTLWVYRETKRNSQTPSEYLIDKAADVIS